MGRVANRIKSQKVIAKKGIEAIGLKYGKNGKNSGVSLKANSLKRIVSRVGLDKLKGKDLSEKLLPDCSPLKTNTKDLSLGKKITKKVTPKFEVKVSEKQSAKGTIFKRLPKKEKLLLKKKQLFSKLQGKVQKNKKLLSSSLKKVIKGKQAKELADILISDPNVVLVKQPGPAKSEKKIPLNSNDTTKPPKKVNIRSQDSKERRIGYESLMAVHNDPEFKKDPFAMISKSIKEMVS